MKDKKLYKDIMFALLLGGRVVTAFVVALYLGISIDNYLHSKPIGILFLLIIAFIYVFKLLLGAGKYDWKNCS